MTDDVKPLAYMRKWAFDDIDVMKLPVDTRPKGWRFHEVTTYKIFDDDVPLYPATS
jgi:hypothetical protein